MGPLLGIKLEFAGLGPAPFCTIMLADMGAEVVRIDRKAADPGGPPGLFDPKLDILNRGRRPVALDLKRLEAVEAALKLIESADILIEGSARACWSGLASDPRSASSAIRDWYMAA